MQAYEMDDCSIYAAESEAEAIRIYTEDCGEQLDPGYPRELTDEELDKPQPETDEDERPTGRMTSIRKWLQEQTWPGFLCGSE